MPNLARHKKRLARAHDAVIVAILGRHYECATRTDAESIRTTLSRQFHTSDSPDPAALCLWIQNYALTDAERAEGYKGHFALIRIAKRKTGKAYTLTAEKHWLPLTRHPGRQRPHHPHPDAGHPLLRSIASGTEYDRMEEAQSVLAALHAQFPRTSIPGAAKLHIAVYSKPTKTNSGEKTPAITKHLIEITTTPEGRFTLRMTAKPPSRLRKKSKPQPASGEPIPTGFFSARESLKRSRKK